MNHLVASSYQSSLRSLAAVSLRSAVSSSSARAYSSASSSDADKYIIPKSTVPTFHFQKSLPRLPIPDLNATLDKYLVTVQPLVSAEEFEKTKAAVESFRKGSAPKLHTELLDQDKANKHTSYISGPWYDMYLQDRVPLPINYNPQITMNDCPNPAKNKQAERSASLIAAALKFQNSLKDEVLYPDIFHTKPEKSKTPRFDRIVRLLPEAISFYGAYLHGAYPLDMSQYTRLFGSTRIPKKGGDVLKTNPSSEHVLIIRNNHFYKVYVRDASGQAIPEAQILAGLKEIIADNSPKDPNPIGILSTENRDKWAAIREELYANNKKAVDDVDSALFAMSLDSQSVEDPEKLSRLFLFGDGCNRWFDKSFSLIVTENGKAAVNFEHSWGDGVAVVRFLDEVFTASNASPVVQAAGTSYRAPEKIKWNLTPGVIKGIQEATQRFNADTNAMDLKVLTTSSAKRQQLKDFKVSPDGFLQMTFQLAYYKLYKRTATTYESASTSAYKHGRTEVIRSATPQSVKFTHTFSNPNATIQEKNQALRDAINNHSKISVEALMGKGVDRHLFALRSLAQKHNEVPEIFKDKAYQLLNTNILSTSTLSSPAIVLGGFGPVAKEGYGIGYGMDENNMRFNVTSYLKVSPFLEKIDESLKEMIHVLSSVPPPSAKN